MNVIPAECGCVPFFDQGKAAEAEEGRATDVKFLLTFFSSSNQGLHGGFLEFACSSGQYIVVYFSANGPKQLHVR